MSVGSSNTPANGSSDGAVSAAGGGPGGGSSNTNLWPTPAADAAPIIGTAGWAASGGAAAIGGATMSPGGSTSSGSSGTGGRTGSADAGIASDASRPPADASVACTVNITFLDAPYPFNLVPGDTATLAVKGTIAWGSSTPTQPNWQWTVKGPDGTPLALTSIPTTDKTTAIVQFPLLVSGNYDISVSATTTTPSCRNTARATAVKPQERSQAFFIRILPPPAGSGQICTGGQDRWCPSEDAVPYEDTNFMLQAGQPRQDDIQFVHGYAVSIDPVEVAQPNQNAFPSIAVPSFVRVSPQGSTWTFDGASTSNQPLRALLHPSRRYDILVIPETSASTKVFPPFLVASKLAQEFRPSDFNVAAGVTLRGTLRGPSGSATGARIFLRADANSSGTLPLPSTVGSADSTGAYSLRASVGTLYSAVVVPPPNTSLPQVTIADGVDLQTLANGASLAGIDFTWSPIGTTTVTIRVLLSDNSTPAAGVAVRLQSQDGALPDVGVLTVAGATAGSPSGSVRQEGTTDANGAVLFSNMPRIAYHSTVIPPSDLAGTAITTGTVDLTGETASSARTLILGHKVKLSGSLLPADAANSARLVATDTGTDVLVSIISTQVKSDGSYEFLADPGRTYRFSVEPAASKNLPTRIPLYGVTTTDQDAQLANRTLPSGLKVSGTVSFSGLRVAGAIVQAYCEQQGIAGCLDPTNTSGPLPPPLVEFATLPDGSYSFYLLDPATGG